MRDVRELTQIVVPLSEDTNIQLLEGVIADQAAILKQAFGSDIDISTIPQVWTLCASLRIISASSWQANNNV
jgi:hypothetical protein